MIGLIHGFPASDWHQARERAREILIQRARRRGGQTITYSDLVAQLNLPIEASDPRLSFLLDEISTEEHSEGRGFLTVLVVHKFGDQMPGPGFFEMAERCGANIIDREEFWSSSFAEVLTTWQRHPGD